MSYGVRYRCEWTSPMREQREYVIEILQRDYSGNVDILYPTGDVLTITQGQIGVNEFEPIKASEAALSLLCIDDGDPYMSLFTTDPLMYKLRVRRRLIDNERERMVSEWVGYLTAGTYSQEYALPPYHVSLKATDGLAILKDIPYLDAHGERYSGQRSLVQIIADIMSRISDMTVSYPWPIAQIHAEQQASTVDVAGIDRASLYSSLGGDGTPSCYDVLKGVLSTLQCQLFQSYGEWIVRPLSALATSKRAAGYDYVNGGQEIMPLYDDEGADTGVSVAANLSLLPPYKSITFSKQATAEEDGSLPSMLHAERWSEVLYTPNLSRYKKGDMLRLQATVAKGANMLGMHAIYGGAYCHDAIFEPAKSVTIDLSATLYNLSPNKISVRVGVFMVDATRGFEPLDWLGNEPMTKKEYNIALWDSSASAWLSLPYGLYPDKQEVDYTSKFCNVDVEPNSRHIPFTLPWQAKQLTSADLSISMSEIPSLADKMYMVVVIAGPLGVALPPIEMRNTSLLVTQQNGVVVQLSVTAEPLSAAGLESIAYDQKFADAWMLPAPGTLLEAPLLDLTQQSMVHRWVTTQRRGLLADDAVASMRLFRDRQVRQIEGEIYAKTMLDLDAMFRDREGRVYYTNYIRRLLRRGIYNVELREIPQMSTLVKQISADYKRDISKVVGLDTSAYFLSVGERNLWRFDTLTNTFSEVLVSPTGTYALSLNEGQRAVSVVSFDGVYYALRAYDTHGKLLSHIERLSDITNVSLSAGLLDNFARSARYDNNINAWVLVGGDATVTYLQMISQDGDVMTTSTYSVGNYRGVDHVALIPNGFTYSTSRSGAATRYSWWHSHSQHIDATVVSFAVDKRIVACNEMYMVIEDYTTGKVGVYSRQGLEVDYDRAPLYEVLMSQGQFVDMNNALVLFRSLSNDGSNAYGATVYDGRTGRTVSLTAPLAIGTTHLWLCGNAVYGMWAKGGGYGVSYYRVIAGDGVGYASYTTSDGLTYKTSDGETYLTVK